MSASIVIKDGELEFHLNIHSLPVKERAYIAARVSLAIECLKEAKAEAAEC